MKSEADPGGGGAGGGAEGAIAPPFPLEHAPFYFVPRPFRLPKCLDLRTCENESTLDVRKEVPINDDEIFIAKPQPTPHKAVDPITSANHELLSTSMRM